MHKFLHVQILKKEIMHFCVCQIHNNIITYPSMTIDHVWKKLIIIVIAWGKGGSLACLTCSLSTEREQVLNSLENMQKSMISMIFKRQKFCLIVVLITLPKKISLKIWQQINSHAKHKDFVFIFTKSCKTILH